MVAYTFYHFCNDVNNTEYVAYMPMTKVTVTTHCNEVPVITGSCEGHGYYGGVHCRG